MLELAATAPARSWSRRAPIAGALAMLVASLTAPAAAQEPPPHADPDSEGVVSEPRPVFRGLAIPTRIRVEAPTDGLELRLWSVTPSGPYEGPFWSDEGRRLCRTPCTLALPEGSYTLGIDSDYQFDFVARGDPLLLRVTPRDQVLRKAGAWMLISGSIQFGVALAADAMLAFLYGMLGGIGEPPGEEGPSFGEMLVGGSIANVVFFGVSMLGLGVVLTGAGLMLGGMGSVDEAPGNPEPDSTGEVFVHRPGDRFFPETTGEPQGAAQKQACRTEDAEAPGPQGARPRCGAATPQGARRRGPGCSGGRMQRLFLYGD